MTHCYITPVAQCSYLITYNILKTLATFWFQSPVSTFVQSLGLITSMSCLVSKILTETLALSPTK